MKKDKQNRVCSNAYIEINLYDYVASLEKEQINAEVTKVVKPLDWREVVEQNLGLVHSRIGKVYGVNQNNRDDIEQAGMLALIKAAQGFDPTLGNKFSSYAVPAIDRAMRRELSHLNGRIFTDSLEAIQEDGDYKLGMSVASAPDEIYIDAEQKELEKMVGEVCTQLTRAKDIKAVKAVALQLRGISPDEIARISGLSRRSYSAYISIGRQILSSNPHILNHISLAGSERTSHIEATLMGEQLTLTADSNVSIDLPVRSGSAGGFSLEHLAKTMEQDDVADYLLGEVAIGEEVTILDEDTKCAAILLMGTDCATVTAVYKHSSSRSGKELCA